ncbi:MAG: hypothetical protein NZ580_07410 [Bacteroidia bacterium]|nr:hypothetical protein [Bacteroidia bacterium]MDW8236504.1 hypothetical protein [Bacteroidia bacterium]
MKARWAEKEELAALWHELPAPEEPFGQWEAWANLPHSWGAVVIEEGSTLQGILPLGIRRIGPLRLYRQPRVLPWVPWRVRTPLPSSPPALYTFQARFARAVAEWMRSTTPAYFRWTLPPLWTYTPPWYQHKIAPQAIGSFIIPPQTWKPEKDLLRKIRQVQDLPFLPLSPSEAVKIWEAHPPPGLPSQTQKVLKALIAQPLPWRAWQIGHPWQALGIFLWGPTRIWYIAGTHRARGQAGTALLYHVIQQALAEGKTFDFSGSTLPTIERFFRQFGGVWELRLHLALWHLW